MLRQNGSNVVPVRKSRRFGLINISHSGKTAS